MSMSVSSLTCLSLILSHGSAYIESEVASNIGFISTVVTRFFSSLLQNNVLSFTSYTTGEYDIKRILIKNCIIY